MTPFTSDRWHCKQNNEASLSNGSQLIGCRFVYSRNLHVYAIQYLTSRNKGTFNHSYRTLQLYRILNKGSSGSKLGCLCVLSGCQLLEDRLVVSRYQKIQQETRKSIIRRLFLGLCCYHHHWEAPSDPSNLSASSKARNEPRRDYQSDCNRVYGGW